jgi:hypothetical protein
MMAATRQDLRKRTMEFALRIIKLYAALPKKPRLRFWGSKYFDREPQSVRITEKRVGLNQTLISSAR